MLGRMREALKQPGATMSWTQLAGVTIFVLTVALLWRQVTLYIMREL